MHVVIICEHDSRNVGKVCVKGAHLVESGHWLPLWLEDVKDYSSGDVGGQEQQGIYSSATVIS